MLALAVFVLGGVPVLLDVLASQGVKIFEAPEDDARAQAGPTGSGPSAAEPEQSYSEGSTGFLHRRRDELHLAGEPPGSFGLYRLVRFWTAFDVRLPERERAIVTTDFRYLARTVGESRHPGFDVLVAADLARGFFPDSPWRGSGIYSHVHDLVVVEHNRDPDIRVEIIHHELGRALWHRFVGYDETQRALTTGVSEYLRFLRPEDDGLQVPMERLRSQFDNLLSALAFFKRTGIPTRRFSPKRFLKLSAIEFHGLGRFGSLLSAAIVACVGGDTVLECFRARSDFPLRNAVERLKWAELMSFVREPQRPPRVRPPSEWAFAHSEVPFDRAIWAGSPGGDVALQNGLRRLAGARVSIRRFLKCEAKLDSRWLALVEFARTRRHFQFLDPAATLSETSVREDPDSEAEPVSTHLEKLTSRFPGSRFRLDTRSTESLLPDAVPAALRRSGALEPGYQAPTWLFVFASKVGTKGLGADKKEELVARRADEQKTKLLLLGPLAPRAVLIVDYTSGGISSAQIVERALRAVLHESVPIGVWRATKDGVISASLPHVYETPR